jgi:diacylglycerol kinase family enzyme
MVIDRERRRATHKLRKWAAMAPAFIRMLRHFPKRRLSIAAEGFAKPYRTPCLFVGNNEYDTKLFNFGKRAHLDRGALWFYVVKPRSPWKFFLLVCRLCFGSLDEAKDIEMLRLREAVVDGRTSRLPVALDGEVEIMPTPLRYRIRPKALHVLAPEP